MLDKKLRNPKVHKILFRPEGIERWQQHQVARGVKRTVLKRLRRLNDQVELHLDEYDCQIITQANNLLGEGRGIGGKLYFDHIRDVYGPEAPKPVFLITVADLRKRLI